MPMTPETLKRVEELSEEWANNGLPITKAEEVMDFLPDLIAAVKERDIRTQERDACYEELTRVKAERDAAQAACAEMRALANAIHDYKATGYTGIDIDLALEVINSTDCGRGYHHDRDCEPLREALQLCQQRCSWCDGTGQDNDGEAFINEPCHKCKHITEALAHWEKGKEGK